MINNNNISPSGDYSAAIEDLNNTHIAIGSSISRTFPVTQGCLYHVRIPLVYITSQSGGCEGEGRTYGWITIETGTVHYRSVYQTFNKTTQNNFVDVYLVASSDTLKVTISCQGSEEPYDYLNLLQGSAIVVQLV